VCYYNVVCFDTDRMEQDMDLLIDVLKDTIIDSARIFPFLFLTYLLMEYIEHRAAGKTLRWIKVAGPFGPIVGAFAGLLPQCGFSAAATGLYAGRIVSLGTLMAVYLSTSDEMLPILISSQASPRTIFAILAIKLVTGMTAGIIIDTVGRLGGKKSKGHHIHEMCESEHCHCEKGIFKSALIHSVKVIVFIFIISFIVSYLMEAKLNEGIWYLAVGQSYGVIVLTSILGLIPNCAISVALTQLYVGGMLGEGALISGLLVGAGIGLMVLVRVNKKPLENLKIIGILWAIGLAVGCLVKALGITFM